MKSPENKVAAAGLAIGAILGMAGTFISDPGLRNIFWAIDGLGVVIATVLLGLKYFRKGNDLVACGFLVFAMGEAVMLSGLSGGLFNGIPTFAAGTALWATGLLFISFPKSFSYGVRLAGMLSAFLFFTTAFQTFAGRPVMATTRPLPFFAYPFLVITFLGWIWALLKEG